MRKDIQCVDCGGWTFSERSTTKRCRQCQAISEGRSSPEALERNNRSKFYFKRWLTCIDCGQESQYRGPRSKRCAACQEIEDKRRMHWHRQAKAKYAKGITPEEYEQILALQEGMCAVCGRAGGNRLGDNLHIDHCHVTGALRGLLCTHCNLAIGQLRDDADLIRRAAEYVSQGGVLRFARRSA